MSKVGLAQGDDPHDGGRWVATEQDIDAYEGGWKRGNARKAMELWDALLDGVNDFPEDQRPRIESNRARLICKYADKFALYPYDVVQRLADAAAHRESLESSERGDDARGPYPCVTFVVLSCKRYDLFTRTMNSFLRCCTDLDMITRWICVDDNSHPTQRACMRSLYPFMEWVWKGPDDAGHARSLNIVSDMIDSPYTLAIEDDWLFVSRMDYIGRAIGILNRECASGVNQVFFNRHYVEVPDASYLKCAGGIPCRDAHGRRYIRHEYIDAKADPEGYDAYCKRYPANFAHQPHFSLRPSLFRSNAWQLPGGFSEDPECDFETEYAHRYAECGMASAYFDNITCVHIGRLNRDKGNPSATPNAYQLNGKPQYGRVWDSSPRGPKKLPGEKLALTVTTCQRLDRFLRSMCTTLSMCKDVELIDKFIAVDDNSTPEDREAMAKRFPFFQYVLKGESEKGHAKSMNIILELCAGYDYVYHTEDDWNIRTQYSLGDAAALLRSFEESGKGIGQVILRWHEFCTANRVVDSPTGIKYRSHTHNLSDPAVPGFFAEWRKPRVRDAGGDTLVEENRAAVAETGGCWWPTLSLNPAVWNLRTFRATGERFDEDMHPTYFEYAISFRLWEKGWGVAMFETEMSQFPSVSAYVLNGTPRNYDANGCENHRANGGDPACEHCIRHKAEFAKAK